MDKHKNDHAPRAGYFAYVLPVVTILFLGLVLLAVFAPSVFTEVYLEAWRLVHW